MERVVPWGELCALIEPFYPQPSDGRPPIGMERMLRIYFYSNGSSVRPGSGRGALRFARHRASDRQGQAKVFSHEA